MKNSLAIVLFVLSLSTPALADKEASVSIYNQGKREYNLGNFEKAISHFEAAYREHEAPAYLYNIAQSYRQLKNCKQALFFYNRFLTEDPNSKKKSVIRGYIADLKSECGPPPEPVDTSSQKPGQPASAGQPYELAAQKHSEAGEFREAATAYEAALQATRDPKYIFLKAEALRLGRLTVEAIGAYDLYLHVDPHGTHAALAHKRKSELELGAASVAPAPPKEREQQSSWSIHKSLAVGLGAAGLVGLGVGSVFGLQAIGYKNDALDPSIGGCDDDFRLCNATGTSRYADAQGAATNSNIAFGVGIAASAAALTLWLMAPSPKRESKTGVGLAPSFQDGSLGVIFSGDY